MSVVCGFAALPEEEGRSAQLHPGLREHGVLRPAGAGKGGERQNTRKVQNVTRGAIARRV